MPQKVNFNVEDPVERENPGLVYCDIDPRNPRIYVNREFMRIIKTCIPIHVSHLEFLKKLADVGYTDSIERFVTDAVNEKLERTLKDYETLGKVFSDKLQSEVGYHHSKMASYDEYILRKSDYFTTSD